MEVPIPPEMQPGWLSCQGKAQACPWHSPSLNFHSEIHHSPSLSTAHQVQLNWDITVQHWMVQAEVECAVAHVTSLDVYWSEFVMLLKRAWCRWRPDQLWP